MFTGEAGRQEKQIYWHVNELTGGSDSIALVAKHSYSVLSLVATEYRSLSD